MPIMTEAKDGAVIIPEIISTSRCLKRDVFPFRTANGANAIPMLHVGCNTIEVEMMRALSCEDGLAFSLFQASQANCASLLRRPEAETVREARGRARDGGRRRRRDNAVG